MWFSHLLVRLFALLFPKVAFFADYSLKVKCLTGNTGGEKCLTRTGDFMVSSDR